MTSLRLVQLKDILPLPGRSLPILFWVEHAHTVLRNKTASDPQDGLRISWTTLLLRMIRWVQNEKLSHVLAKLTDSRLRPLYHFFARRLRALARDWRLEPATRTIRARVVRTTNTRQRLQIAAQDCRHSTTTCTDP